MNYSYHFALNIAELKIGAGKILGILGENGSGKSSLINCIAGYNKNYTGDILLDGTHLNKISIKKRSRLISYHPQNISINFGLSVYNMIMMGRRPHIEWNYTDIDREIVENTIEQLNIMSLREKNFNNLSGGEQQKVILARTFVQNSQLMIFDEPNNNLDIPHVKMIMDKISELTREKNKITIMVLHDLNTALRYCDEILLLRNGQIFMNGPKKIVLSEKNLSELYDLPIKIHYNQKDEIEYIKTLV
jgi:iron complex transport system ATP-binding protein